MNLTWSRWIKSRPMHWWRPAVYAFAFSYGAQWIVVSHRLMGKCTWKQSVTSSVEGSIWGRISKYPERHLFPYVKTLKIPLICFLMTPDLISISPFRRSPKKIHSLLPNTGTKEESWLIRTFPNSASPRVCNAFADHNAQRALTQCVLGKGGQILRIVIGQRVALNPWRGPVVNRPHHPRLKLCFTESRLNTLAKG
jgi:hypothetical protein